MLGFNKRNIAQLNDLFIRYFVVNTYILGRSSTLAVPPLLY
jgi:hypothetical protein